MIYRLVNSDIVKNCCAEIARQYDEHQRKGGGRPLIVNIKRETRTSQQNRLLHAMLGDIASQWQFGGKYLDIDEVKALFVSGYKKVKTGESGLSFGLEGELYCKQWRTSTMTIAQLNELIEYISAWASNNNIKFKGADYER